MFDLLPCGRYISKNIKLCKNLFIKIHHNRTNLFQLITSQRYFNIFRSTIDVNNTWILSQCFYPSSGTPKSLIIGSMNVHVLETPHLSVWQTRFSWLCHLMVPSSLLFFWRSFSCLKTCSLFLGSRKTFSLLECCCQTFLCGRWGSHPEMIKAMNETKWT